MRLAAAIEVMSQLSGDWMGLKLPAGSRVAHKTGAIDGIRHDVGIITLPSGRAFVLCVYGAELSNEKAGEETIADVARVMAERVIVR